MIPQVWQEVSNKQNKQTHHIMTLPFPNDTTSVVRGVKQTKQTNSSRYDSALYGEFKVKPETFYADVAYAVGPSVNWLPN
jgi:hypothetical protein